MMTEGMSIAAEGQSNSFLNQYALPALVVVLGSTVLGTLATTVLANLRAAADARRDRYAKAMRSLVAWVEYAYRIRRRTDDSKDTLAALAERGHTLQEQLAESRAWIAAESRAVSQVYEGCIRDINTVVRPAIQQAWNQPPVNSPAEMILGDFGPRGTQEIFARLEQAIHYRFGLRRIIWSALVLRRLGHEADRPENTPI
jgi:hypothetical protein